VQPDHDPVNDDPVNDDPLDDDPLNDPAAPVKDVLAPLQLRAIAQLIDSALVTLPVIAAVLALGGLDELGSGELVAITAAQVVLAVGYETVAIAVWSMTIGKRIVGIQVVRSDNGERVTWTYASVRALVPAAAVLIPYIGPALSLVVYLRAFFHPLRQGLHDAAAGPYVVTRRRTLR
jgi:uncharacterized RDD family membrane protein YckC